MIKKRILNDMTNTCNLALPNVHCFSHHLLRFCLPFFFPSVLIAQTSHCSSERRWERQLRQLRALLQHHLCPVERCDGPRVGTRSLRGDEGTALRRAEALHGTRRLTLLV